VVAEQNPAYGLFVEREIARLGREHPTILSQYELKPVARSGSLFPQRLLERLRGEHARLAGPVPGPRYVAGVDVGGGSERAFDDGEDADSTVVTIAEVEEGRGSAWEEEECAEDEEPPGTYRPSGLGLGRTARVVEIVELRGSHMGQGRELARLLAGQWTCQRVVFDATGVGAAPCQMLGRVMGARVVPFVFGRASKSALGYELLAAVEGGRVKMWAAGADDRESNAFWQQVRATRRTVHEGMRLDWRARSGHDDYVASLALCLYAADGLGAPYFPGVMIPPVDRYADDRDF
jgi:hypothetical protein